MAATTLMSPPPQQPLTELGSANMMDMDLELAATTPQEKPSKKRKSELNGEASKKKKREAVPGTPSSKHCHQCHQSRDVFLECTYLTTRGKKTDRCGKLFCQDCLKRRYDEDTTAILAAGRPKDFNKLLGHVHTEPYVWLCPICRKICNCAPHRKQYGLPPTGFLTSFAKEQGLSVAQLLQDPNAVEAARLAKEKRDAARKEKAKAPGKDKDKEVADGGAEKEKKEKKEKKDTEKKKPAEKKEKVDKSATEKGKDKVTSNPILKPSKSASEKKKDDKPKMLASAAPVVIKPFVKQPKYVSDPEFEFIGISYPLEVIEKRLRVREFLLRFEKLMYKLPPKYFRTINDPNSEWTDLTYRNLITNLLAIVQADANQLMNGDMVYEAIDNIKKVTADSPDVWNILKNLLETVYEAEDLKIDCAEEDGKLNVIMLVMHLALQSSVIRAMIEDDGEKERERHKSSIAQTKRLKSDWEQTRGELQKERLLLKPGDRTDWDDRYASAFNAHKKLVARVEEKEWFSSRKTSARNTPLGIDIKGNTYWLFTQRDKREEDWGQWIVVQKNPTLPHPSGTLPSDEPANPLDDASSLPDAPEEDDEEIAKARIWYAVEGASNIRHLAKWIRYQTDLYFFKKANESAAFAATPPDTPRKKKKEEVMPDTPSRQLMVEVRMPHRTASPKLTPEELVTKENTEAFYSQLLKVAGFMELNGESEKLI
ncbi:hypothetical protein P167DRAFT_601557 [Morchella conica CCBAS932]|uniref:Zinc-finger domain-containing protein n=1 Tax=Morchella conica CCBAS932 TaxID=1392247 RepID=A0A3N4L8G6_9PEZI|nr:hypothetical protein P167DRAFT_601557 [Morchella conica CCBAS932]